MSEANKALIRRLIEEGINKGDERVIEELISPEFAVRGESMRTVGVEGFKELTAMFRAAFPDMRMEVEDVIVEGDKVITWAFFTGTHNGPLQGMPPTGKRVRVKDVDFFRVRNGKVVESDTTFDRLDMLRQLGMISVPEGVAEEA